MQVTLQDRERLNDIGGGLEDILDTLVASVQGGWDVDHLHNGHHGAVDAQSVSAVTGYTENGRTARLGHWSSTSALTFSGNGTMTFAPTDYIVHYSLVGRTCIMSGQVRSAVVGGAANTELRVSLPLGIKCRSDYFGTFGYSDNGGGIGGGQGVGIWGCTATATYIAFYTNTGANWTLSPGGLTYLFFTVAFEISQEDI